jgi:hypothetical protein
MMILTCCSSVVAERSEVAKSRSNSSNIVTVGGAEIVVRFSPGRFNVSRETLLHWVRRSAQAVSLYYGKFPVRQATVRISPESGDEIGFATADFEGGKGVIEIPVGVDMSEAQLDRDWVLTHEMVHFAFPLVDNQHKWVAEGMATYVEPVARMRAGITTPAQLWGEFSRDMPQGLPASGDRGLNRTPTWGRTYWGGALFCLLADLQIRSETGNKKGLEDALRGIVDSGINITTDWEPIDAFRVGDKAVGTHVLERLYQSMKDRPVAVNLPALWRELGVTRTGNLAAFDNSAPLAMVRLAINGRGRS